MNDVADIFRKYQSKLNGFITRRVPTKEDAEDILQEVFYKLSRLDQQKDPVLSISSWLYSVARNQITDKYRKKREEELSYYPENESDDSFIRELTVTILDESASPETDYLKSLIWEELEVALSELPEEQRLIFELTELQGISFKEIADSTGVPVNTLLSRKRYAVVHLRKRLYVLYNELLSE
ncbi:MAG: sigma-70 family RNA polymerase sigma factor [Bacteroides sp.]|nr:sigma-70 family RNA polymerase sigma factor [Bacteroides sp.]